MDAGDTLAARRTQVERRQTAEERILEAALELVAERGAIRMTLEDVGKRAGYSRALPAHYFGNKDGLIVQLIDHVFRHFRRLYFRGPRQPRGLSQVMAGVEAYVNGACDNPLPFKAFQILKAESSVTPANLALRSTLVAANEHSLHNLEHHIQAGIERGEISADIHVRGAAIVILGAMRGTLQQVFLDPDRYDADLWRASLLHLIRRALTARPRPDHPAFPPSRS